MIFVWVVYGYVEYGDFKYLVGFLNFGYLNLKVFIGGMLLFGNLDCCMSFDKFNFFMIKGMLVLGLN